jgi:uncharacterized membrane protein
MPRMPSNRFDRLDALRGIAIVWMTLYHFAFDLNHFGYWRQDFYRDPLWTWQRTVIVGLFLFCAGLGQAVAVHHGQNRARFWRRWIQISSCALLVTVGSYFMYPQSFIFFGVLHGIAVMLVIVRLTASWGRWLWLAGALVFAIKLGAPSAHAEWAGAEFFDQSALSWLGLASRKPLTEDYVPLFPWLGVMWWGVASGQWLLHKRIEWLASAVKPVVVPLSWLGRWSLSWYMVHQPVLIGLFMAVAWLKKSV